MHKRQLEFQRLLVGDEETPGSGKRTRGAALDGVSQVAQW